MKYLKNIINGLCMAVANSVPGVSGGTIALLMGFYDDFIGSINDVFYKKGRRIRGLIYILTLGIGWFAGMVSAILLLDAVFERHIYIISSIFFGFVLCSIPIMIYDERKCLKGKYYNLVFFVIGAALISGITYISTLGNSGYNLSNFSPKLAVVLFFAGALAIIAMLLPGISGSTVFLVFGLYQPIFEALKSLISFDMKVLPALCFLGAGAIAGGLGAVKGIKYCLEHYRSQTVYMIIGMLTGSLYSIMMGPVTLDTPKLWMAPSRFNWLFFAIGAIIIAGLQFFKIWKLKRTPNAENIEAK